MTAGCPNCGHPAARSASRPERDTALAGAEGAINASAELLRFAREGRASDASAWSEPYGADPIVQLADAARLAIVSQGGPRDGGDLALLAALHAYLEPCGIHCGTAPAHAAARSDDESLP